MKCPYCNNTLSDFGRDNDIRLLKFCKDYPRSIREISEELGIAPKNVFVRLTRLEKQKLIVVYKTGKGKKTFVKSVA